jgi:hypothetical protein
MLQMVSGHHLVISFVQPKLMSSQALSAGNGHGVTKALVAAMTGPFGFLLVLMAMFLLVESLVTIMMIQCGKSLILGALMKNTQGLLMQQHSLGLMRDRVARMMLVLGQSEPMVS